MSAEIGSMEFRQSLQLAIEKRFPERQHYRDEAILELATSLVMAYPKMVDGMSFLWDQREEQAVNLAAKNTLWEVVEDVLDGADQAVTRFPDDGLTMKRWGHQSLPGFDGKKDVDDSASMDSLNTCAANYCKADWAESPTLELWLVRQMIYAEAFAFSREAGVPLQYKSFKFWWLWTKSLLKWVVGLGVAFSIGDTYGLAVGVLTYVVWLGFIRYLAQDQVNQLTKIDDVFSHMKNAYALSLRSPPCPVELEKFLSLAENNKVVWPAGLRSLVELAIARNRAVWL